MEKEYIKLNENDVENLIHELSLKLFNYEFTYPVKKNTRLKKAFARYNYSLSFNKFKRPLYIECSNNIYNGQYKLETIISVLIHELCHWWLSINNQPFDDKDCEFKELTLKKGGTLTGTIVYAGETNQFYCSKCNSIIVESTYTTKYLNKRYVTNCCNVNLKMRKVNKKDTTKVNIPFNLMELKTIEKIYNAKYKTNLNDEIDIMDKVIRLNPRKSLKENLAIIKSDKNIKDLVIPVESGKITKYSIFIAVKYAIKNNSKDALQLIKKYYYNEYINEINNLSEKQKKQYLQII